MKNRLTPLLILALAGSAPLAWACCSLAPAKFSQTLGWAGEARYQGKLVHLLGYQNRVQNLATSGGNAMLLPLPARPKSMSPKNILDTSSCPHLLIDMENSLTPMSKSRGGHEPRSAGAVVFDHDIYTIVLAENPQAIPAALKQVKAERRPALSPEIFKSYGRWYPGWTFALCCFNNRDAASARPMVWWYEPCQPEKLFFPALDAHDGKPPDLKAQVGVDHMLMVSSHQMGPTAGSSVVYREKLSGAMQSLAPSRALGRPQRGQMLNGDFYFDCADVRQGRFRPQRVTPPN